MAPDIGGELSTAELVAFVDSGHNVLVAAGANDGNGTVGIAYGATIMAVRSDAPDSCAGPDGCSGSITMGMTRSGSAATLSVSS